MAELMTTKTYPRPAGVSEAALLDALFEAGADSAAIGIGNTDMIGLSIEGASEDDLDAIWERAMLATLVRLDQGDGLI